METQIFHSAKKYNLQKNPLKQTKILQDIITLELISSFNTSQNIIYLFIYKKYHLKKILI
jgi:hypothetical protein